MSEHQSAPKRVAMTSGEVSSLITSFLGSVSRNSAEAYRRDLEAFARHVDASEPAAAIGRLLSLSPGAAHTLATDYRSAMTIARCAPTTINRRLATLRSLVSVARVTGHVSWQLQIKNVRADTYRDTRGPQSHCVAALLAVAAQQAPMKAARDIALVRLLHDLALRRGEVVSLDLADFDMAARRLWVTGKGRTEKTPLTLPGPTLAAISAWISSRGEIPGPLFTTFDPTRKGNLSRRLTGQGLWTIIKALGKAASVTNARPHGLRHAGITRGLDLTGGDVRAVQRFSRHANLQTLITYDDNRTDLGGKVAALVAGAVDVGMVGE